MSDWLYVLDLQPTGYVKVGRTDSIGRRVGSHVASARLGGGQVAQIFATQCADVEGAEKSLIQSLRRIPGAKLVVGREVFTGITFAHVVTIANGMVAGGGMVGSAVASMPDFVADVRSALQEETAIHLAELLTRLVYDRPEMYGPFSVLDLSRALRRAGVPTGQIKICGRNRRGIRSAALAPSPPQSRAAP